jgi:Co/Zn/Cd efflux system component
MIFSGQRWTLTPLDLNEHAYMRVMWIISAGILVFGTLQCALALVIGSSQLLKDGLDWAYNVALYGIAAFVFGRGVRAERLSACVIALILAVAGFHTLYSLWSDIQDPQQDEPLTFGISTVSSVVIAFSVVAVLWRFREDPNPLVQATWLSSRNDAISSTLSALTAVVLKFAPIRWPEYVLSVVQVGICFQATWAIVQAELRDQRSEAR